MSVQRTAAAAPWSTRSRYVCRNTGCSTRPSSACAWTVHCVGTADSRSRAPVHLVRWDQGGVGAVCMPLPAWCLIAWNQDLVMCLGSNDGED